ncbi:MAG: hypothetical protein Q8M16_24695 [Pirellulaceae bacterium]|nr:hypothetical protein [Pirellulaceae bacterium]
MVKPAPSKKVAAAVAEKKLREKSAAKREAARSGKPVMAQISAKAPVRHPDSAKLSKNQIAENVRLGAKASKSRMAMSGNVHIKSHVAAANRRSQSRRDGK